MPGRNFNSTSYDYGFGGKRKDNEIAGNGNYYDYEARMYDPRLGRTPSGDPHASRYPFLSPYSMFNNNPILNIDKDGRDFGVYVNHETKTIIIKANIYTVENSKDRAATAVNYINANDRQVYTFKDGDNKTEYQVKFELTLVVKGSEADATIATSDDSEGNLFLVKPNDDKRFKTEATQGRTYQHKYTYEKETIVGDANAVLNTDAHEIIHTLTAGDGHATNDPSSIMYESTTNKDHGGLDFTKNVTQNILKTADIGNKSIKLTGTEVYGKPNVGKHETGAKPNKFDSGYVRQKEKNEK
jgi:RHS repeat-associated protein